MELDQEEIRQIVISLVILIVLVIFVIIFFIVGRKETRTTESTIFKMIGAVLLIPVFLLCWFLTMKYLQNKQRIFNKNMRKNHHSLNRII